MNNLHNAESAFKNFNEFFDQLLDNKSIELVLEFTASEMNGGPILVIEHNNVVLYQQEQPSGEHRVTVNIPYAINNHLKISMIGKNSATDTRVVDGKIVQDKFITFKNILIDSFDVYHDTDFYHRCFQYYNNDSKCSESVNHGFWANSTLSLDFDQPFVMWYNLRTTKNIDLANSLQYRKNTQTQETLHHLISAVNKLL